MTLMPILTAAIPVVVLVATVLLCGLLLLRPFAGALSSGARRAAVVAVAVAAGGELLVMAVAGSPAGVLVWARLALTVAAPAILRHRRVAPGAGALLAAAASGHETGLVEFAIDVVHVAAASVLLGAVTLVATAGTDRAALVRRLTPWAVGSGVAVAGTGILLGWLTDLRLDTPAGGLVLVKGAVLVIVAAVGLIATRRWPARLPAQIEAAGLVVAVAAGGLLVATAWSPPVPGVPLMRTVSVGQTSVPLLVVPNRPGPNLVHTTASGVSVGIEGQRLTPTVRRDGAPGAWALVDLPAGSGRLWVGAGGARTAVDIDTGHERPAAGLAGPDGPECASAALGALLAGAAEPVTRCPADRLTAADAVALRALMRFLAGRGMPAIAVTSDGSPRAAAAAALVHAEAVRRGVAITAAAGPTAALVVVSGWAQAATVLRDTSTNRSPVAGSYLAPWLLTAPVLDAGSGVALPLRFDPYTASPLRYTSVVGNAFPGQVPTAAGYTAWQAHTGPAPAPGPVKLYAAARIAIMSGHSGHDYRGWLPGGRLTAVTGPLGANSAN